MASLNQAAGAEHRLNHLGPPSKPRVFVLPVLPSPTQALRTSTVTQPRWARRWTLDPDLVLRLCERPSGLSL